MPINFQKEYKNLTTGRVFIIFSTDDTVIKVFISHSVGMDLKIQRWIVENNYEENRIECLEVENCCSN